MALRDNLVSYWPLDGNSIDIQGVANGTDTGATYGSAYGKLISGLLCNGSSTKIRVSNAAFGPTAAAFSVQFWIKVSSGGAGMVWGCYTYNDNAGYFCGSNAGKPSFQIYTAANVSVATTHQTSFEDGAWHHVVCVWDYGVTNHLIVYLDGVVATTLATATTIAYTQGGPFPTIGACQYNGGGTTFAYTTGDIDEVGFWSRALSSTEVAALYNGGAGLSMLKPLPGTGLLAALAGA